MNIFSKVRPMVSQCVLSRSFATAQPSVLNRNMGEHQWYVHLSRQEGADLGQIKKAMKDVRAECKAKDINLVVGFGPSLLKEVGEMPDDFQEYKTFKSIDGSGREAKGTQEELLLWFTHDRKDLVWKTQYDARNALEGHMKVARETMTFMTPSHTWDDMTGFIDGTGNPAPERDTEVAIVPDGQPGAGGSFIIAQRWIHDLKSFNKQSLQDQEGVFGRTKADSTRLDVQPEHSHLSHVELTEGKTGDNTKPKRGEMSRRSTPYAFHDGSVGLYFMGFCREQAPLRERMEAMYGINGQVRDKLTDFSNPASGSFYFAPSEDTLNSL
jgi:putative iron-dependent peroxidase